MSPIDTFSLETKFHLFLVSQQVRHSKKKTLICVLCCSNTSYKIGVELEQAYQ